MYHRLCCAILLTISSNSTWAACENEADVCLDIQSAAVTESGPAAGTQSTRSDAIDTSRLVDDITADLKARRLTKPIGDNALEKILNLKDIEPNHDYSINGIRYVARIYLSMAQDDLRNNRVERARIRLADATEVFPSLPGLQSTARQIEAASALPNSQEASQEAGVEESSKEKTNTDLEAQPRGEVEKPVGTEPQADSKAAGNSSVQPVAETDEGRVLITPIMVGLPAGSFVMGSESGAENEKPAHQVQVGAFSMSRYEITREQYFVFKTDTGIDAVQPPANQAQLPVSGITSDDADAFTSWLSSKTGKQYRLPTEAEWEYAVRAGTVTPYHSGDAIFGLANCLTCLDEIPRSATPVGSFAPNDFGLYDMHGNVAEWTSSCSSANYFENKKTTEQACAKRVVRGGSWRSTREQVRSSYRVGQSVYGRSMDTGLRVVHDGL